MTNRLHWYSVWQLVLSLLGVLLLWGFALPVIVLGTGALLAGSQSEAVTNFMMAGGLGLSGLLLLPSAGLAFLRLIGHPVGQPAPLPLPLWHLLWIMPAVVLLGHLVSSQPALAWWLLPVFHGLVVLLPVLWLVARGSRGLQLGSPQRQWGALAAGLVLAPFFSLIFELLLAGLLLVVFSIYLAQDARLLAELGELADQLNGPVQDPERVLSLLKPYLIQPGVLGLGFLYGALAVPLIEELFKPAAVWLLAGHKLTPQQGFGLGLISGAGYALFESIALSSGVVEGWAAVMVARMGTSMVHILTAGLTGWALACAWRDGRYLRLALAYLGAVALHALWNGLVLSQAIFEILPAERAPLSLDVFNPLVSSLLGFLTLASLVLLLVINARLSRAIISPAALLPVALAPAAETQSEEDSDYGSDNLFN